MNLIPLYDGALRGNKVGSIVKGPRTFDIIRPGYDAQGRRRTKWTQIVHDGVPIFEMKVRTDMNAVLDRFDQLWGRFIGPDDCDLADRALAGVKRERTSKFRDGRTGVEPAPSVAIDGRGDGQRYSR